MHASHLIIMAKTSTTHILCCLLCATQHCGSLVCRDDSTGEVLATHDAALQGWETDSEQIHEQTRKYQRANRAMT